MNDPFRDIAAKDVGPTLQQKETVRERERGLSCGGASVTGLQPDKTDTESECNDGALQTADSIDER